MFQKKMLEEQLQVSGVRLGDGCNVLPISGKKKAFTLNRKKIDIISAHHRPSGLSMSYVEIPHQTRDFHYRLELDEHNFDGRFFLRSLSGTPFWLNGLAAREAYVERSDRLYIEDSRINFVPFGLKEITQLHFDHPVLMETNLLQSELNILITGETGTGKSHLARKIHEASGRRGKFIAVNLSSYNPQLIESELFGHKKGSFTGAIQDKSGAFNEAQDGTLFLDEIDSLPLELQTKLLTFLDNKKFRPVGETKETAIRTRLIIASGRKLELLLEQGHMRRDFFFRLKSGQTIELPSLRNDIKRIQEVCQWYALEKNVSFSVRLIEFYQTLAWPGNLRQLIGHLDKKRILSRATKLDFDQSDEELMLQSSNLQDFDSEILPFRELRDDYIRKAYARCNGNLSLTARKIQMNEKTIRNVVMGN